MPSQEELDRIRFSEFLDEASRIVDSWPDWKKNCLGMASKAHNDVPRRPVDNSDSYYRRKLNEATDEYHKAKHRLHVHILERATTVIDTGVYE